MVLLASHLPLLSQIRARDALHTVRTCCNIDGIGRYWDDTLSTEASQKVMSHGVVGEYPIQKTTEICNKNTEMYKKNTELEISCWNVLFRLRSEVAYIGSGPILP